MSTWKWSILIVTMGLTAKTLPLDLSFSFQHHILTPAPPGHPRLISQVILHSVKPTVKINHHTWVPAAVTRTLSKL